MKLVRPISAIPLLFSLGLGLFALQKGGPRGAASNTPTPTARTCPRSFIGAGSSTTPLSGGGSGFRGFGGGGWAQDYPKADNDCLIALRRLTRINSPSPLNVADLDSDHLFDYPWIYAINVKTWTFTDEEAKRLHDYLLKGGFLMVDHFHGTDDWDAFHGRHAPGVARRGKSRISRMPTRSTTSCTTSTKSFRSPASSYVNSGTNL